MKLFPGMTAYVTIPVATANDVIEAPNAALRYKPDMSSAEIQAAMQKIGATGGRRTGGQQSGSSNVATLWKLAADNTLQPVLVKTGITDHTNTEIAQVLKGELQPGEQLVTGKMGGSAPPAAKSTSSSPLTPSGPRRGR
jgi:HlyD family secretion protein